MPDIHLLSIILSNFHRLSCLFYWWDSFEILCGYYWYNGQPIVSISQFMKMKPEYHFNNEIRIYFNFFLQAWAISKLSGEPAVMSPILTSSISSPCIYSSSILLPAVTLLSLLLATLADAADIASYSADCWRADCVACSALCCFHFCHNKQAGECNDNFGANSTKFRERITFILYSAYWYEVTRNWYGVWGCRFYIITTLAQTD